MRAMTKSQLARAAGVSRSTFWRWLKDQYIQQQIEAFQWSDKQKKLPGRLVKIICEHYVIDID